MNQYQDIRSWLPAVVLMAVLAFGLAACSRQGPRQKPAHRLQVVTTLFPLYDMARTIGGNDADVTMLLPPGVEPHSFEPRPGDILRLNSADLFIYTGRYMEPWAVSLIKGLDSSQRLSVIDASSGITLLTSREEAAHDHKPAGGEAHHTGGLDPHIWLDFGNARTMVTTILQGFVTRDPDHAAAYRQNAAIYQARLAALDRRYRDELATCGSRTIIQAGHLAFGYLAKRYDLKYVAAFPASGDAEPNARQMTEMVRLIRSTGARYVFYEELVSPRLADTLARETGTRILMLHAAHNVSREELHQGITFPELMERNLTNLTLGLRCR